MIGVLLKGILIGFASLAIPGLGASTIAIILGIYYQMIDSISSIFKDFKKSIVFLLFLLIGYAIGAIIGSIIIDTAYQEYPFPLIMLVLGFIIGSIPKMVKDTKESLKKKSGWVTLFITLLIIILYSAFITNGKEITFDNMEVADYIILGIVGLITSTTLVVPGVDFAVVLLSLGYYYAFIGLLADVVSLNNLSYNLPILFTYLVGYGVGSFILSKFIKKVIDKHEESVKVISLAFVLIAPFIVIEKNVIDNTNFYLNKVQMLVGVILFLVSFLIILMIYRLTDPDDERIEAMKKRNMFRLYYSIVSRFFHALYYLKQMRKIIKEDGLNFKEKYDYGQVVINVINKSGHIYPKVYGEEHLNNSGTLYCVNHQGRYDGLGVLTALKDYPCSFLADKSRVNFPFFYELCVMLDSEYVDRSNMRELVYTMKRMAERLKKGNSFIVFIEGKYGNNGNTLQEFQTGVLHPAYESKANITPVVLYDSYKVYSKSSLKKIYPEVHFLKPITYEEYKDLDKRELAEVLKSKMQEKLDEINLSKNR